MDPEFDPKKDAANVAKHGVSLVAGDGVLNDPLALTIENSSALDEQTLDYCRRQYTRVIDGSGLD